MADIFFLLSSSSATRFCSFFFSLHRLHTPLGKPNFRICFALFLPSAALALWVRISLIFDFPNFPLHFLPAFPQTRQLRTCLLNSGM
ncbi:hypothetical protein SLEP1_g3736 [Rubroshorea leprosula]|uniref:Uncharacterized protein n=1 Tax=Rubroshorea leprosula TaxID=152421 RepID=A0AAV5HWY4_9ROSI|nr:hypothetical protein SLEP1_g3736 [Rubroshorea leprosula]